MKPAKICIKYLLSLDMLNSTYMESKWFGFFCLESTIFQDCLAPWQLLTENDLYGN